MFAKKSAAATKPRHYRADGYRKNVCHFLVCKFLYVDKQNYGPELRWKFVQRCQDLAICDLLSDCRRLYEVRLQEFLVFLQQRKPEPLASLMADAVEQNLVEPRPAIRARFEPLEGTPSLQIHFLEDILSVATF